MRAKPPLAVAAIAAVTGLALAATVFGLWWASPGHPVPSRGPLVGDDTRTGDGYIKDAREAVSVAGIEVANSGAEPIVLERVTLVDPDEEIRLLGALAGQRTTPGMFHAAPGFPPRQPPDVPASDLALPDLAPLAGYVVPPQPGVAPEDREPTQLFIGLASTAPKGKVTLQSFRIYYRVGYFNRYALLVPYSVAICTPRVEYVDIKPCGAFLPEKG